MERRYSKSRTLDSFQLVSNRIHHSDILRQYRIKVYKIVSMTLLLLLLVTGALQSTKAELAGIVRDPSGLPVPEAEVRIANAGTDAESKTGPLSASISAAVAAYERGATILRVQDVREHVEALAVARAVAG